MSPGITTRRIGDIPGCKPIGSNRGEFGQMIDDNPHRFNIFAVDAYCRELNSWVNACELQREARTGNRRVPGFEGNKWPKDYIGR